MLLVSVGASGVACRASFPSDQTPEGAYARISLAIAEDRVRDVFAYLEDEAQWAAHTVRKEREAALSRARTTHPHEALAPLEVELGPDARAADGADVFARIARARGWVSRLRRDLSGVARIERDGDRATVVTARGTRYPMKRRIGGIWGLTLFTAELVAEAEKATRDRARIFEAAEDWASVGQGDAGADAKAVDAGP